MKKIRIKDYPEKYIPTLEVLELTGLKNIPKTLQKYSKYGTNKTFYHINDVKALIARLKKNPQLKETVEEKEKEEEIKKPKLDELFLEAYVDGSFNKDTGVYGSAVILINNGDVLTIKTSHGTKMNKMRHIAGEISAAALAVKMADEFLADGLVIKYDYEGVEKWATGAWKTKNEYTSQYADFMNRKRPFPIKYEHVKAHTGDKYNELADDMAVRAVGLKPDYDSINTAPKQEKIPEDALRTKYQVKASCIDGIKEFHSKEKHAFKDYLALKTGTGDSFSKYWNEKDFDGIVSEEVRQYIKGNLADNNLILGAMRWVARGLDPYDAVKKVKVDDEIYKKKNQ